MRSTWMPDNQNWLHGIAACAFLLAASPNVPLMAQGLDQEGVIDTIVGSDVSTGEEDVTADEERILAAIENTLDNAAEVRRKFSLDKVDIVFLPNLTEESSKIEAALDEHREQLVELREAIEGSAMFYHAVDSRGILLRDIVALEFDDENGVVIFVAGQDPNG